MTWGKWFQDDTQEREAEAEVASAGFARDCLAWADQPHFIKFMAWLDGEASKPFPVDNDGALKLAAIRSNCLREIKQEILRDIDHARDTLKSFQAQE